MAAFFALYHSAYSISDVVLHKHSRWYRSLDVAKKKFVRAYIVRIIWAGQSTATALILYKTQWTGKGLLIAEVSDILRGWSGSFESWAYPSTLAFAAFENYIEFRQLVFDAVVKLTGRQESQTFIDIDFQKFSWPNALQLHHILFFLVEAYSYKTQSIAYITNLVKIYELTAPFSFACWAIKERIKFQESTSQSIPFATVSLLENATLARIIVWVLCRFAPDIYLVTRLFQEGLLPSFMYMYSKVQQNQHWLLFGNKLQLWFCAPIFIFWLHPYWFRLMVKSYIKLHNTPKVDHFTVSKQFKESERLQSKSIEE